MYHYVVGSRAQVCLLRIVPRHSLHIVAGAHVTTCLKSDVFAYLTVLPPSCAGQPVHAPFWYMDGKFPHPARMKPRIMGHSSCGATSSNDPGT